MAHAIDLHTHSTASDGIYTPTELLQQAHAIGLHVLALTDHDTTAGLAEASATAERLGIDFIPGIEINTDIGNGEIHVLGYYIQYERPAFQQTLQILRDARERRGQRMVELLNAQGVAISWERVRDIAGSSVGRPHVAKALLGAGYVETIAEAFDKYIGKGCPAYVPHYKLAPSDAVRLIRSANGLPVMAHPISLLGLEELRKWLPALVVAGLVGLETYYGPYTEEDELQLRALADQYHLIPTGGTDFHGPGIHPTPLGGRFVPFEVVRRLKAASEEIGSRQELPTLALPPPLVE